MSETELLTPPAETQEPEQATAPAEPTAEEDHAQRIAEAEHQHTEAAIARAKAERELKAAKATEKHALERVQDLRERGPDNHPLFDIAKKTKRDAWRDLPVTELGIKAGTAAKLAEADPALDTLGKLSDHMAKYGSTWNGGLKGIGEAAMNEVEEAFAIFWAAHPEYTCADGTTGPPKRIRLKTAVDGVGVTGAEFDVADLNEAENGYQVCVNIGGTIFWVEPPEYEVVL